MKTITFLGDSLTYGFGLARQETFPALIAERLAKRGRRAWRVVNAGVNGETTQGGVARVGLVLQDAPEILFVALGGNDAMRGVPAARIEANLRAIVEAAIACGSQVVLAGMRVPALVMPSYVEPFNALFPRIAEAFGLARVPFLLEGVFLNPSLNLPDRVHPNPAGMKILAQNAWASLQPVVATIESASETQTMRPAVICL